MPASHAPARSAAASGGPASISWIMRLPITTASASRGDRLRARRIANAEAHADRHLDVPADLRELARDVGGVEWPAPVTPLSET